MKPGIKQVVFISLICCLLVIATYFLLRHIYFQSNNTELNVDLSENQDKSSIVSFVVIGDPEGDLVSLNKALQLAKEKKLSPVIIVGDLTNLGTEKQYQAIKSALDSWGITYFTIPGNHDLWYGRDLCQKQPEANCNNTAIYQQYFGNNFGNKTLDGFNFFLIDNSDEYLGLGESQWDWFNKQPVSSSQFPAIIFAHIPLYHPESNEYYVMGSANKAVKQQAEDLLDKFCQNPPLALFFGHLHRSRQYEYNCPNGNKLKMFNVGSINSQQNWQLPRFLKVEITGSNEIKTEEIVLN